MSRPSASSLTPRSWIAARSVKVSCIRLQKCVLPCYQAYKVFGVTYHRALIHPAEQRANCLDQQQVLKGRQTHQMVSAEQGNIMVELCSWTYICSTQVHQCCVQAPPGCWRCVQR
jgi:hypothetical protein